MPLRRSEEQLVSRYCVKRLCRLITVPVRASQCDKRSVPARLWVIPSTYPVPSEVAEEPAKSWHRVAAVGQAVLVLS